MPELIGVTPGTPENGYFLNRVYCDHYNCTCPHGIKGTDPNCEMHHA
jgi:hypothetical protein